MSLVNGCCFQFLSDVEEGVKHFSSEGFTVENMQLRSSAAVSSEISLPLSLPCYSISLLQSSTKDNACMVILAVLKNNEFINQYTVNEINQYNP